MEITFTAAFALVDELPGARDQAGFVIGGVIGKSRKDAETEQGESGEQTAHGVFGGKKFGNVRC
jgi:hypothetical protein